MIRPPHFIWSGVTVDVAVLWGSALDCHNTSQTLAVRVIPDPNTCLQLKTNF